MPYLKDALNRKVAELQKIMEATQYAADLEPDILRVSSIRNKPCYYSRPAGVKREKETYSGKIITEEIKELAQQDYDQRLYRAALRQSNQIRRLIKHYDENELAGIFGKMASSRRELIRPLVPDTGTFACMWETKTYPAKLFDDYVPELYTEKGERVRSKSEKIIADHA